MCPMPPLRYLSVFHKKMSATVVHPNHLLCLLVLLMLLLRRPLLLVLLLLLLSRLRLLLPVRVVA